VTPVDDHPGAPHDAEVIRIGFDGLHVSVRSQSPRISAELRATFGPMVIDAPAGSDAGNVDVAPLGAQFAIRCGSDPEASTHVSEAWAAREAYHAAVKLLMRARRDLVWIHAGAAAWNDRAFLFAGPSGQGKSTIVSALLDRGWTYLSDEIAAVDATAATVTPFPLAPRRRVHEGELLPHDDLRAIRRLPKVDVAVGFDAIGQRPLPLARVVFLTFDPTCAAVRQRPVSPAESVLELLRNSLALEPEREREIASLARLVGRVPTVGLAYPDATMAAEWVNDALAERNGST